MKYKIKKASIVNAMCLLGISAAMSLAHAHGFSGTINGAVASGGGIKAATEVWQLECNQSLASGAESTSAAAKMVISIQDGNPGSSLVGVTLFKKPATPLPATFDNRLAQTTIDTAGGTTTAVSVADRAYSTEVSVPGGEGIYYATVFHTGTGVETYNVTFHCEDVNNVHSGTNPATYRFVNQ